MIMSKKLAGGRGVGKDSAIAPGNCAILLRTADGVSVGRCWFRLEKGVCPRHGDVSEAQRHYAKTGRLTDENLLERRSEDANG